LRVTVHQNLEHLETAGETVARILPTLFYNFMEKEGKKRMNGI